MGIILKVNELGFKPFLDTPVNSFIIGLKDFCINQNYFKSIKELPECIDKIKIKNKNVYLNLNLFAKEKDIKRLKRIVKQLIFLNVDGFIVSDLGIANVLKANGLGNKVMMDLHTYVTNKYSAKSLLDLGIKRVCVAKEITLEDIKEISAYCKGKIEIQCQGYYPMTYSKRPLLETYYKKFKLKNNTESHYIKEESRDSYYCLTQSKDNLTVYYDKEYSVFPYLDELVNYGQIRHFRIDANFLDEETIKEYINMYSDAINYVVTNKLDKYNELKEEFINKHTFETPFMNNKSFLLKEGK